MYEIGIRTSILVCQYITYICRLLKLLLDTSDYDLDHIGLFFLSHYQLILILIRLLLFHTISRYSDYNLTFIPNNKII